MIVVLTNSQDATASFLVERARALRISLARIDTDTIATIGKFTVSGGKIRLDLDGVSLVPGEITGVWLRRPKPVRVDAADSAEAAHASLEWGAALEGFLSLIPESHWVNHPKANAGASHKIEQLTRAPTLGLRVPATLVTQDESQLRQFWEIYGSIIAKPLASGYLERSDGDTMVLTTRVPREANTALLSACPTLFQEEISKETDVRACIVDDLVDAVSLSKKNLGGDQILDIREANMAGVQYSQIEIPAGVRSALIRMARSYNLRFAAVDLAIDQSGNWIFFEINPNGQWAWLDQAGVTDIGNNILRALKRSE